MQGEQRANAQRSRLTGRVAIVTGGGRGLGRAMALGLAQAGVYVVATAAREAAQLEAVAREAQQICGEARIIPHIANVIEEDDCSRVVETAIGDFGRLDILVNNAGRGMKYISHTFLTDPTKFWEVKPETWRMVIDTNVNGPFLMSRSVVPVMLRAGWGADREHLDELRDDASPRFLAVWPLKGRARIGNDYLVTGSRRHGYHRECAFTRGCHSYWHDSRQFPGRKTINFDRPCNHRTAVAVAGFGGFRRDNWPTISGDKMAY